MNKIIMLSFFISSVSYGMHARQVEMDKLGQIYRKIDEIRLNLSQKDKCEKLPTDVEELVIKVHELSGYYRDTNRGLEVYFLTSLELMMKGEVASIAQDLAKCENGQGLIQTHQKLIRISSLIGEAHGLVHAMYITKSYIDPKKLKLNTVRASL